MKERRRGWPLFVRIFAALLAGVVVVQFASYVLLVAAGPPAALFRTVDEVATALRKGSDPRGDIRIMLVDQQPQGAEVTPVSRALASRLGIAPDQVLLAHEKHDHGPPTPFVSTLPGPPHHDARAEILFGSFVVAVHRADGRWLTAVPIHTGWEAWRRDAMIWFITAVLALLPFALLISRGLARPIAVFSAAAERLGRDPHAPLLAIEGPPEIREAAETFNEMQRRLSRYVEDRTMLIGAIAHDMRTPLMRLALRPKPVTPELRGDLEADIAEIDALITAATSFVRDTTRPIERRPLELRSLVEGVTDEAADCGQAVSLAPGDPITFYGNPVALKALVSNLVGNAVKYAGDAQVTMRRSGEVAVIEVRDHGSGIPPEDLPRLFEPFFRGERSRNRDTGGLGLGLASIRAVARGHGGEATIANHPDGGTIATVVLPL